MLHPGNESSRWSEVQESNQTSGEPGAEVVIVPVVFGLIFVIGVLGNSLVMLVIGRVKPSGGARALSPTNIFIVNLSVADLLFLLFCVPLHATIYSLPEWVFGAFLCKFGHFFTTVSMLVSILTLVAMSVDRYIAVVRSKSSACVRSRRKALVGLCVIWSMSLLCSVPVAQSYVLTSHPSAPNKTFCWEIGSGASRRPYKVSILMLGFVLPLLLICCCYIRVLWHLHKKMKNMSKRSELSKRKTAQTIILVVTGFTICWMPHHIIAMWAEFGTFPLNNTTFALRIVSHCLSYGNSCINPILYAFLSENFRKACRQVFARHLLYKPPTNGKVVRFRMDNFSTTHSSTNI
ncbi:galanin receptor type 1b [Cyprinodon tularosa]|uniref:Galanin receptor type 1-like n=1 Tax=Cyprinodon variegatus TaxID=28743 RepID=A0A3Q2G9B3_CYPVA|nr:PREDICTED: galanin receptor type 1-like [Cyprinodon variegatus]XP_038162504.1 galanin receptor type 1b [Cyprinodon tularosa]